MRGTMRSICLRAFMSLGTIIVLSMGPRMTAAQNAPERSSSQDEYPPRVVAAYKLSRASLRGDPHLIDQDGNVKREALSAGPVGISDAFALKVENFQAWATKNPSAVPKLVLYLDGRPLIDERPRLDLASQNYLVFDLVRTGQTRDVWKALLGSPSSSSRTLRVTIGPEGASQFPFESDATIALQVLRTGWTWVFVVVGILALIVLLGTPGRRLAASRLIRDHALDEPRPYSLALVQMAWWFLLVVVAYVGIYAVTGYYDVLNGSVLALIGMSAGTKALATVVDTGNRDQAQKKLPNLMNELDALNAIIRTAPDDTTEALEVRWAQIQREIGHLILVLKPPTRGFWKDILTFAGSDTELHRLQMVVWTLILSVIFGIETWRTLAMPEFPPALLGLMGISLGTYVGFKAATQ
jgi:hypothetical protein